MGEDRLGPSRSGEGLPGGRRCGDVLPGFGVVTAFSQPAVPLAGRCAFPALRPLRAQPGPFQAHRSDQFSGRDACGSKSGARVAQPCLGDNGVLVIAEDVLDRGDGRGEPPGLVAADRSDGLGRVAALLGPDADGVPLRVG